MAKRQIIISNTAQADRLHILNFWIQHNKSTVYSIKLDAKFKEAFDYLQRYPLLGVSTNYPNVYAYVILNYKIFYQISGNIIFILRIWDSRQDPKRLNL